MADIFGRPNEGIHRYRLCGLAIIDVIATGGIAALISLGTQLPVMLVFLVLVLIAIIVHEMVGVNTRLNAAIFGRPYLRGVPEYCRAIGEQ